MNAKTLYTFLCLAAMASAFPVPNVMTSPLRHVRSTACVTSRDHSAGTCAASGPSEPPCSSSPYWLQPCAGCSPVQGEVIGPGHPLYQTPATPTADPQCLLERLRAIEQDLQYIITQSEDLGRETDITDTVPKLIELAHEYNIPTTFKCRQGQKVTGWIQAGLVTFASHMEEVWKGENHYLGEISDMEDCRISRATNDTRENIGHTLCQISNELSANPVDTCAEGYTGSGACHAPSTSSVALSSTTGDDLERWARDHVINLYFQKFIRKSKRLLRNRIL